MDMITIEDAVCATTLTTTSHIVAEVFEKQHKNLIRDIRKIHEEHPEFARLNFELTNKFNDLANRNVDYYTMTKNGFMFLVMGFTGKKAGEYKIAFINEFDRLQENNRILQDIVWEVINGQKFIGQEQGLKCAGVKHPRLFMKHLKDNPKWLNNIMERKLLEYKTINQHKDMAYRWTHEGFHWLLDNKERINGITMKF